MSYSIIGNFDIEGKEFPFKDICFDILKILNERSYSVCFNDDVLSAESYESVEDENGNKIPVKVYNSEAFEKAISVLEKKREDEKSHLAKLEEIRTSVGYYTMSEDGKNSFEVDLACAMEELDDIDYKLAAVRYAFDVMQFVSVLYDDKVVRLKLRAE
jgi:hypothetical protein